MIKPEILLFDIDQLRIKHRGQKHDIEKGNPYINKSIELIEQFQKEVELESLENIQFLFKIQSDLSCKTIGYRRLCEKIIELTK